ncbi:MAG: flagellar hook protein FlgE [Desulfobacterales bacterium]
MSLSSSLFSGISGLSTLGNAMQIIGDNIANVNTVGFKSSRVTFQDVLSQTVATTSGSAQVGRGSSLADISSTFSQGSFESTDSATDLAIGGEGFFVVRDPNNANNEYYTRAGEFRFDKDGNFVNPAGYIVRGWALDPTTGQDYGSMTDITMSSFTSSPSETQKLTAITNLDSDATPKTPLGLETAWDGSQSTPIQSTSYEYQTTVKAYDSLGSTHDVTVYYDAAGNGQWNYIVTCNPDEDVRTGAKDASNNLTAGAGLLAKGTIDFVAGSGTISGMTMDSFDPSTSAWTGVSPDTNGYLAFQPEFISGGNPMSVELNIGARSVGSNWVPDSLSSSQFSSASTTIFQSADGYGAGDLQSVSVDTDGVITGQYSNGQVLPLYRVALAKFQNNDGLFKVGGNLWRETRLSGDPITGTPGSNGTGNISANSLEQSNVDIANEFVKMITTQRGFQANSKIITVTDQMLADLINIKR